MGIRRDEFCRCLYFEANALARRTTKLAEEAFAPTGLSPSHAFVMMAAVESPGISPGELGEELALSPSTVTRLVEKLENRGFLKRISEGRSTRIQPTSEGKKIDTVIRECWNRLHLYYTERLGKRQSRELTSTIGRAVDELT